MPRVKRGVTAKKKRRKILKLAKGFFRSRSSLLRTATEAVNSAMKLCLPGPQGQKKGFPEALDCPDKRRCAAE